MGKALDPGQASGSGSDWNLDRLYNCLHAALRSPVADRSGPYRWSAPGYDSRADYTGSDRRVDNPNALACPQSGRSADGSPDQYSRPGARSGAVVGALSSRRAALSGNAAGRLANG
jgi:hypothetical protein